PVIWDWPARSINVHRCACHLFGRGTGGGICSGTTGGSGITDGSAEGGVMFIPSGAREPLRIAVMANASLRCALISPNTSIIDALRSKRQRISCLVDRNCLLSLAGFMVLARQQRSRSLAFAGEIVIGAVF